MKWGIVRACVRVCVCASFSIVESTFGSVGIKELSTFVMVGLGIGLPLSDERANEGPLGVRRGKRNQTWALVQWTWPVSMRCSGVRWRLGGFVSSCHGLVLSACGNSSPVQSGQSISVCLSICGAEAIGERWVADEQTFGFHFVVFSPTVELVRICTFVL